MRETISPCLLVKEDVRQMKALPPRDTAAASRKSSWPPVLFSGGVASNALLRREMGEQVLFAEPHYSTDNAMGVAILTLRALERGLI